MNVICSRFSNTLNSYTSPCHDDLYEQKQGKIVIEHVYAFLTPRNRNISNVTSPTPQTMVFQKSYSGYRS